MSKARNNKVKLNSWVSITDFGNVGDGSTDATDAFNNALATGKNVYLPPGTYVISSTVYLNQSGQRVYGNQATLLKAASFIGSSVLRPAASKVRLENFAIDGNDKTVDGVVLSAGVAPYFTAKNLYVYDCLYGLSPISNSHVTVTGCTIETCASGACRVHNIADSEVNTNILIENCTFDMSDQNPATSTKVGLLVRGTETYPTTNARVINNTFIHCVEPTNSGALNCELRWCDHSMFNNNHSTAGSMLVSIAGCEWFTCNGNTCDSAKHYGIEVASPTGTTKKTANIVVSNNTINGGGVLSYAIGLQGTVETYTASVTGNTIMNVTNHGIFVTGFWSVVAITGNTIDNRNSGVRGIYLRKGVSIPDPSSPSYITITGNILQGGGSGDYGIQGYDATNITISGNSIMDWATSPIFIEANVTTPDNFTVTGNFFKHATPATCITTSGTVGDRISAYGNNGYYLTGTSQTNVLNLKAGVFECWGSGSPEGAVAAGVGSVFHRDDGGAGTSIYIKESGSGNTGWVAK